MRRFAKIKEGIVSNIGAFPNDAPLPDGWVDITNLQDTVGPMWTYDGSSFSAPVTKTEGPLSLYFHVSITGGDGADPIGFEVNSNQSLDCSITLRATKDPASQIISTFSGKWRVNLRDSQGAIHDIVGIRFIDGIAKFSYPASRAAKRGPAIVNILEEDFLPVEVGGKTYKLGMANPFEVKFYEDV